MNAISAALAVVVGVLTIFTGDVGLGLLWIVVGSVLFQLWAMEKRL